MCVRGIPTQWEALVPVWRAGMESQLSQLIGYVTSGNSLHLFVKWSPLLPNESGSACPN